MHTLRSKLTLTKIYAILRVRKRNCALGDTPPICLKKMAQGEVGWIIASLTIIKAKKANEVIQIAISAVGLN